MFTPTVDNGGRTSLQVSWNAPTTGDMPTMYRVDYSTDTDVWHNVVGGEESGKEMLYESMAMENCTSDDEGNRCYTVTGLTPGKLYHFRVFAMNDFGTSGISVDETLGSGMTLPIDPPAKATGLEATDYYVDKIVVTWDKVEMTGGADVLWYCLGVASSPSGAFADLTDATNAAACLSATAADSITDAEIVTLLGNDGALAASSPTAVIAAMKPVLDANDDPVKDADGNVVMEDNLSYTHENLGGGNHDDDDGTTPVLPDEIELRYRLYAVTDPDGDATTTAGRKIARAASEVATGRTIEPADTVKPGAVAPHSVGNLRAVAYTTDLDDHDSDTTTPEILHDLWEDGDNDANTPLTRTSEFPTVQGLHLFWTHPSNYPDLDDNGTTPHPWRIEVQRRVPRADDHPEYTDWQFVPGLGQISTRTNTITDQTSGTAVLATGYGVPQFTVGFAVAGAADATIATDAPTYMPPTLWGDQADNRTYRVRYVNRGGDLASADDDVEGPWTQITIPRVTTGFLFAATDLDVDLTDERTSTLPIILDASTADATDDQNSTPGLRFEHDERTSRIARDHIKLLWERDANARPEADGNKPTGYVIDRSDDGGITWQTLTRADSPTDLGTADTFTDSPSGSHKVVPGQRYTYRVFPVFIESQHTYGAPALVDAASRGADLPTVVRNLRVEADGQHAMKLSWDAPSDDGGHEVKGYLIQVASLDTNGDPDTFTTIAPAVAADAPLTTKVTKNDDGTVKDDGTMYKYNPTTGTAPDLTPVLSPGAMRWFRVIPITDENDGDDGTGGTQVNVDDGTIDQGADGEVDEPSPDEPDPPSSDDQQRATPVKGSTTALGDADPDKATEPPAAPMDLTAEAASDTNALADSARGVFLTWNEVEKPDTATDEYRIERIRMNTGVDALNSKDADEDGELDWQYLTRVSDVTSWTDPTPLRQDEETRYYRVGSEAIGMANPVWVSMKVSYALHMNHAPDAPMNVMAMSSADGTMMTVTWEAPGSTGGSDVTGYKVMYKMSGTADYMSMDAAADATSATIDNLTTGADYDVAVVAVNMYGDSPKAMATAMTHGMPGMPTAVMGESSDDGTMLTVSWMAPESDGGSAITGYKVMYKMTGSTGDYMSMDAAADATMATISGLSPNTSYDIAVMAVNAVGDGAMGTATAMTSDIAPGMPTDVTAMADNMNGRTQINVSWMMPESNGGSDLIGYALARKYGEMDYMTIAATDAASWWNTLNCEMMNDVVEDHIMDGDPAVGPDDATSPYCALYAGLSEEADAVVHRVFDANYDTITGTEYMDMGLKMGATYMYQVKAVNAAGASMPSEAATGMTDANMAPMAGDAIADVTVTEGMTATAQSTITDADGDTLKWSVMSSMEMYATAEVDDMGMVTITGVAAGMATITVTAMDDYDGSDSQDIKVTVVAGTSVPGMPMGVMAAADEITPTTINVTWTAPDDGGAEITGYMVERGQNQADPPESPFLTMTWTAVDPAHTGTGTTYMDEGLDPNTAYYYRVRAMNAEGYGAWSDSEVMATTGTDQLTVPTNVMGSSTDTGELRLTWEGAANADFYILLAVDIETREVDRSQVNDGAARMGDVTGLNSGARYLGIVVAVKLDGDTSESLYERTGIVPVQ